MNTEDALSLAIQNIKQLPGIGEKTATRLAHFIIRQPEAFAENLSQAILEARKRLQTCQICCNFTEEALCPICANPKRADDIICVVEGPSDLGAFEKGGHFQGKYHVLHGALTPLEGVNERKLKIKELKERIEKYKVREVILATNPTVEGDTTALYIARLIQYNEVKITRIAYGIPVGAEIEYLDGATLEKALENRVPLSV